MRDSQFAAEAEMLRQRGRKNDATMRLPVRIIAASSLAIAVSLGLTVPGDALARSRVTIDESVLESLGPEPSIASLVLRPPRSPSTPQRAIAAPAPRALAQAPTEAPRSRLLLPGGTPSTVLPAPQIATAPPVLRLPQMAAAAPLMVRPAPDDLPRSRLIAPPAPGPVAAPQLPAAPLVAPQLTPPPQLALAPPALAPPPLLPTPPVAPAGSGVRAAPAELPRSQLLLPPSLGERAPTPPARPVAALPSQAAPSSWPSLAGSAIAAPLPPTLALPAPAVAPPVRPVASAAPTARDIQPPAPSVVPTVAPSTAPSSSAARSGTIGARLLFQRGTLDPADGSREALSRLAAQLAVTPNRRVQIMAYAVGADSGTENSNDARRLSLDRALAVRSGLVQQGVRSTQVTVRALGNPGGEGPPDRVDILLLED